MNIKHYNQRLLWVAVTLLMTTAVLTSCTSDIDDNPVMPNGSGKGYVHIEIQCDLGDGADTTAVTRSSFNHQSFAVKFTNNDVVYVGNGGRYIGQLKYRDGLFTGDILEPTTDDYLHMYFLGNKKPEGLKDGETTALTLDISDQKKEVPFLLYGKSHIKYSGHNKLYYCQMECMCGLVEFDVVDATNADIQLLDMHTNARIDFANPDNPISTAEGTGAITLFYENDHKRFAAVLPQKSLNTLAVIGNAEDHVSLPPIEPAMGLVKESAQKINPKYYFSVGNGKKVVISQGDLRYRKQNGDEWCFAGPWDRGIGTPNDPTQWKDAFDFWGWNNWAPPRYEDGPYMYFKSELNGYSNWRILSDQEWNYLLGDSPERKDKWCVAKVNGRGYLIVFPDKYDGEQDYKLGKCTYYYYHDWGWNEGIDWDKKIQHGAVVFLFGWEYASVSEWGGTYKYELYILDHQYWTFSYDKTYWDHSDPHPDYYRPDRFYFLPWSDYYAKPGKWDRNHVRLVRDW